MPGAELNNYAPLAFSAGWKRRWPGQMEYSYFPGSSRSALAHHFTELDEASSSGRRRADRDAVPITRRPTIRVDRISSGGAPSRTPRITSRSGTRRPARYQHPAISGTFDSCPTSIYHPRRAVTRKRNTREEGWGHSTVEYATDVAPRRRRAPAGAFHHDPATTTRPSTGWRRWPATRRPRPRSLCRGRRARGPSAVARQRAAPRPTCRRWCVVHRRRAGAPRHGQRLRVATIQDVVDERISFGTGARRRLGAGPART